MTGAAKISRRARALLSRAWRWPGDLLLAHRIASVAKVTRKMAVIADAQGRIEWVNEGFERQTGYTLAEAVGKRPGTLLSGPGKDTVALAELRDAVRHGRDVEVELLNYTKDRRPYWVRLELRALRSRRGVLKGFIALETDITRRKAMEASLRAANERFEQIAQQSLDVIWELDPDGLVTYINATVEATLGYRADEVLGRPLADFLVPSHGSRRLPLKAVAFHHEQLDQEVCLRAKNGEHRQCIVNSAPIRGESGEVTGFRGAFNDITERRVAEQRLQESEARFKRAMRGSTDGLWDLDLTSGRVYASSRFKALLGYDDGSMPDHVNLQIEQDLLHPEDLPRVAAARVRHLDDDSPFDLTVRMRCIGGDYRWFRIRAAAERDESGVPLRLTGILSDVNALTEAQNLLQWRALHDPLTGLANRQLFLNRLESILRQSDRRQEKVYAILAMDFDRFKVVNDLHGHDAGDELLCSIARRLTENVRHQDLVARFGGDEFMVLLDDIGTVENVAQTARRLAEACARGHRLKRGVDVHSSASIGVLILDPYDDRSTDIILREADAAMYQAKAECQGGYRFFDRELRLALANKAELESDLRHADYDRDFHLRYQPIVDLVTGRVVSFEALLRWRRDERGLVSPAEFIPIAEDTGLILPIGRWVFDRACRDLAEWRARTGGASGLRLSINLSRRQMTSPTLSRELLESVRTHALDPRDLTLEITETALIDNRIDLLPAAEKLKSLGFRLAMDDFGTGQSSLNSLVDLPIDVLKIDQVFISKMSTSPNCIAVVNAVIALARHLRLKVVAEGIDNPVDVATLQAMDCRYGQGYHFAQPMSADEVLLLMQSGVRANEQTTLSLQA